MLKRLVGNFDFGFHILIHFPRPCIFALFFCFKPPSCRMILDVCLYFWDLNSLLLLNCLKHLYFVVFFLFSFVQNSLHCSIYFSMNKMILNTESKKKKSMRKITAFLEGIFYVFEF